MRTNELQNEVKPQDEICELTVEELESVGGGNHNLNGPGNPNQ